MLNFGRSVYKEDTKGTIRRTDNTMVIGQRINNDLQKYIQKTKDRVTQTPLKSGGELMCLGRVSSVHYNL